MKYTGERQVSVSFDGIRLDHLQRYDFAATAANKGDLILDLGCGIGYGSYKLAEQGGSVTAIDFDQQAIDFAKENWQHGNIVFKQRDILQLNDSDLPGKVDLVTAFEVVEHVIFDTGVIQKAKQLLKTGGLLFVSVPNQTVIPHTIELNPYHIKHYSLDDIQKELANRGFTVEEVRYQNDEGFVEADGKFIVIKARSNANTSDQEIDYPSIVTDANSEINKRADTIRKLQKQVRKLNYLRAQDSEALKLASSHIPTPENIENVFTDSDTFINEYYKLREEKISYIDQILTLRGENQDLRIELEKVTHESEQKREAYEVIESRATTLSSAHNILKAKYSELEEKYSVLAQNIQPGNKSSEAIKQNLSEFLDPSIGGLVRHRFFIPYYIRAIKNTLAARLKKKK